MLNNKKRNIKRKKIIKSGFSLLELVVVIVIIGILLSIMFKASSSIDTAKINTSYEQILKIKKAVDDYMTSNEGKFSYSALPSNWEHDFYQTFSNGKKIKSGFGTYYNLSTSGHYLIIKVNTRKHKNCKILKNKLEQQVSSVNCNGSNLTVKFNDGN